jgi:hypothetical protein
MSERRRSVRSISAGRIRVRRAQRRRNLAHRCVRDRHDVRVAVRACADIGDQPEVPAEQQALEARHLVPSSDTDGTKPSPSLDTPVTPARPEEPHPRHGRDTVATAAPGPHFRFVRQRERAPRPRRACPLRTKSGRAAHQCPFATNAGPSLPYSSSLSSSERVLRTLAALPSPCRKAERLRDTPDSLPQRLRGGG